MRAGLTVSVILHLVLVAWGIVTLPSMRSFDPSQIEAVPVDFIPIAAKTELDRGKRTAALKEKRVADRPTEKLAERTPPPPVRRPQPPTPMRKPVVAEPDPLPLKQAKAKPGKPPPSLRDEAPAPQAKPADAPPPPPAAARAPPANAEAPVPRPRPQLIRVAEAQVQSQPEKRTDATSDDLAALIDRSEPTGSTNTTEEEATFGGRTTNPDAAMTADETAALRARIESCWSMPSGATSHTELRTVVRIALNEDGSLAGIPEVLEAPSGTYSVVAPESVVRAIRRCAPYDLLPVEKYADWREIEITFDPIDKLPG
jgi:outer membrane biosynthesis protein TonB